MAQDSVYPLISIIFPVYNVEKWVEESLASVCSQTYKNLEIIVVNDGSTDSSAAICSRMAESDHRIRLLDQENGGLSAARNAGLDFAQGEYVLFIDSDDVVHKSHVELLYTALVEHGADIAVTDMTRFSGAYESLDLTVGASNGLTSKDAIKIMLYQKNFDSCAQSKLAKTQLWDGVRFPVGYLHEDLPTTYKLFLACDRVVYVPSSTYGYRWNYDGINLSPTSSQKVRTLDLLDEMVNDFEVHHPDLINAALCLRASFCFHLLLNCREGYLPAADEERLKCTILRDRRRVLLCTEARRKTRLALALSFFGWDVVYAAFALVKRDGQKPTEHGV